MPAEKGVKSNGSSPKDKKKLIIGSIVIGVFLFGGAYFTITKSTKKQAESGGEATVQESEEAQSDQEEQIGLGVTRSAIIDYYETPDMGFTFSMGDEYEGYENYIGLKGTTYIQLFSKGEELALASINGFVVENGADTGLDLATTVAFGEQFDTRSGEWVDNAYNDALENCDAFSSARHFGVNEFTLSCQMLQDRGMLSLSVRDSRIPTF